MNRYFLSRIAVAPPMLLRVLLLVPLMALRLSPLCFPAPAPSNVGKPKAALIVHESLNQDEGRQQVAGRYVSPIVAQTEAQPSHTFHAANAGDFSPTTALPEGVALTGDSAPTPTVTAPGGVWTHPFSVTANWGYSGTLTTTSYVYLPLAAQDYDPAWAWTGVTTPTLTPSPFNTPLIIIDRQGQAHLFWDTLASEARFVYHSFLTAQGWTTPTVVAPSLGYSYVMYHPAVGQDGRLHFIWRNSLTSTGPHRLLYAAFDGVQWSDEEEIYRTESAVSLQAMPHFGQAGGLHATFLNGYSIYHSVRGTTGWSTPVSIPRPHAISWVWPNHQGGVHLYGYGYPELVYYSYWRGGQFLVENAQTSGTLSGRETQLDGLDNLHLFWVSQVPVPGGNVRGLHYQCLSADLEWGAVQVLTGDDTVDYSGLSKATDWGARFALTWGEVDAGRVRLGVWQDCALRDLKTIPPPTEGNWYPTALAISDTPNKICMLVRLSYSTHPYRVICVDILR